MKSLVYCWLMRLYHRTLFRHMATTLPYSGILYGISAPLDDQGIFSEFLLFTCNDYKVGSERGFLDAAWGSVNYSTLKDKAEEAYRIKPHVDQDIDFLNGMFAEGRIRQVRWLSRLLSELIFCDPQGIYKCTDSGDRHPRR